MGKMPRAIRQQEQAADAALEAIEKSRSERLAPEGEPAENATATAANTRDDLMNGPEGATPSVVTKTEEPPVQTGDERMKKMEHALSVLQGKYDAEVPRYAAKIRELESENDTLREQVDRANELKEQLANDPEASRKYLTAEELEDIDPEALDFQSRLSRGVAETLVDNRTQGLKAQVDQIEQEMERLRQAQADAAAAKFWTEVDRRAPGAAEANAAQDPGWVAFLSGTDNVSRLTYRDLGAAAVQRGDAEAVANLFNLYRKEAGLDAKKPSDRVAGQVAPAAVGGGKGTASGRTKVRRVKQSEVRKAYQDAALGKITYEDLAKLESEFDRAADEGLMVFDG